MFRPIAKPAHIAHKIAHASVLMTRDESAYGLIKIKRSRDDDSGNHDADRPVKNSVALHNKVPVGFVGRYFDAAREYLNSDKSRAREESRCQLRVAVFWMPAFSCGRHLEHSAD
jgi:hypothetical protein